MYIKKRTKIGTGEWVLMCPLCNTIHYSSKDPDLLPEYAICDCDKNGNKQEVYELFDKDGERWIRRNKYPRFIGRITFGEFSDIEDIEILDECENVSELASAMRKAGEFLIKASRDHA